MPSDDLTEKALYVISQMQDLSRNKLQEKKELDSSTEWHLMLFQCCIKEEIADVPGQTVTKINEL